MAKPEWLTDIKHYKHQNEVVEENFEKEYKNLMVH